MGSGDLKHTYNTRFNDLGGIVCLGGVVSLTFWGWRWYAGCGSRGRGVHCVPLLRWRECTFWLPLQL